MASPQLENGYTKIADEILDALARTRVPGQAMQVLCVIIRKTYGWGKKQDKISTSQIVKATGLKKNKVCAARDRLEQMNIIRVTQKGNTKGTTYQFNKNFDTWKPLPKKVTVTQKGQGVPQLGNKPYPKKGTTINTPIDTKQKTLVERKRKTDPNVKKFIDWWFVRFEEKTAAKYMVSGGKEGQLIKQMLKGRTYEELVALGETFFNSTDKFIQGAGYTIGIFHSQINKLSPQKGQDHDFKDKHYEGTPIEDISWVD